jgi:hypothetical protein
MRKEHSASRSFVNIALRARLNVLNDPSTVNPSLLLLFALPAQVRIIALPAQVRIIALPAQVRIEFSPPAIGPINRPLCSDSGTRSRQISKYMLNLSVGWFVVPPMISEIIKIASKTLSAWTKKSLAFKSKTVLSHDVLSWYDLEGNKE